MCPSTKSKNDARSFSHLWFENPDSSSKKMYLFQVSQYISDMEHELPDSHSS
jgi:hypothetical protein